MSLSMAFAVVLKTIGFHGRTGLLVPFDIYRMRIT